MNNEVYIGDCVSVLTSDAFKKYRDKVSIIYIDPPYNTKNRDLPYRDSFGVDEYRELISDSLSAGKDMLARDGVIFISIDDNSLVEVRVICDVIFGSGNFLGTFITNQAKRSNAKHVNVCHEYVLCYAKDKRFVKPFTVPRLEVEKDKWLITRIQSVVETCFFERLKAGDLTAAISAAQTELGKLISHYTANGENSWLRNYNLVDEYGRIFYAVDLSVPGNPRRVDIDEIPLRLDALPSRGWVSDEEFIRLHKERRLHYRNGRPYRKKYLNEAEDNAQSVLPFYSRQGTEDLKRLGLGGLFETAKPVELIKHLIRITGKKEGIVLDFFAGSGTTGQAVAELNLAADYNLNFLLVQRSERLHEDYEAVCYEYNIPELIEEVLLLRLRTVYSNLGGEPGFSFYDMEA